MQQYLDSARAVGTVQTRYRVPDKGQMKEQDGFLVSKSLSPTYPLHPEWEEFFDECLVPPKHKEHVLPSRDRVCSPTGYLSCRRLYYDYHACLRYLKYNRSKFWKTAVIKKMYLISWHHKIGFPWDCCSWDFLNLMRKPPKNSKILEDYKMGSPIYET